MSDGRCGSILVRGVNWIGDAVMTMPALQSLRIHYSGSKIALLVNPWVAPLFDNYPHVDEVIIYRDEYKSLKGRIKLVRLLKKRGFCEAVLLQNAIDAAVIAFLARIPRRIGYNRDARGFLLTETIPFDERAKGHHHTKYYLDLLERSGIHTEYLPPWIYLTLDERLEARALLKDLCRPIIAINPGATYGSSKKWGADRFAEVALRTITDLRGSVVLLGGTSDKAIAEDIMENLTRKAGFAGKERTEGAGIISTAGKTTLRQLAAIISESDVLVTNDSGPMHIGYAVGTPIVAIFGSTSAEHTGPVGPGDIIIKKEVKCSPCLERECREGTMACMELVKADEVFEAVIKQVRTQKAVFFDRDGTLCKDVNFLRNMKDLSIFPEISNLERLRENGYALIGVSNQSGIARGLMEKEFVDRVNRIFIEEYGFEGFYYCPHHPDQHCRCRKPEPAMLYQARTELGIDLRRSFVVGDKDIDMILAKAVGAGAVLVKTGQHLLSAHADHIVSDLSETADIILRNGKRDG